MSSCQDARTGHGCDKCKRVTLQVGTDVDPLAVKAAQDNAALNSVGDRLTTLQCSPSVQVFISLLPLLTWSYAPDYSSSSSCPSSSDFSDPASSIYSFSFSPFALSTCFLLSLSQSASACAHSLCQVWPAFHACYVFAHPSTKSSIHQALLSSDLYVSRPALHDV